MKMFWLESDDHSEDWFVVANNEDDAERFFCLETGYDECEDGVQATLICDVEDNQLVDIYAHFAQNDLIECCGGIVRSVTNPELLRHYSAEALECLGSESRVVTMNGRTYIEGNIANTIVDNLVSPEHIN